MRVIRAVVFEPVGCLAEFPAKPFNQIAARLFEQHESSNSSGSEAYWELLDLIEHSGRTLDEAERSIAEQIEIEAVDGVQLYEDVVPALAELNSMGIKLMIATSLSAAAVSRFLVRFSLGDFFSAVWSRDNAGGVRTAPLAKAIETGSFPPEEMMCLVDTTESLEVVKDAGVNSILMINDYDEGRRLAMHAPTGGIVSLHELPDAIRLVTEKANAPR